MTKGTDAQTQPQSIQPDPKLKPLEILESIVSGIFPGWYMPITPIISFVDVVKLMRYGENETILIMPIMLRRKLRRMRRTCFLANSRSIQ